MKPYIINFTEKGIEDTAKAGIKNAAIGRLQTSYGKGINVPKGFAISVAAYCYFKQYNNLDSQLAAITAMLDREQFFNLSDVSQKARKTIINSRFPKDLEQAIITAYDIAFPYPVQDVAVRSSAVAQCPAQPDSFLNISGPIALLYAIKCCYASMYSEDFLRAAYNPPDISIGIQQMIRADMACSGIAYTDRHNIYIEGSWGLGQDFTANFITPDRFIISKTSLQNSRPEIVKNLGSKSRMLVYNDFAAGTNSTMSKSTVGEMREQFILDDAEIITQCYELQRIEHHLNHNVHIEWAKDGISGSIYIVQIQPHVSTKLPASL